MLLLLRWSFRKSKPIFTFPKRHLILHEYQAQTFLSECGVPVPKGGLALEPVHVKRQLEDLGGIGVVKAQILAGGRGKGTFHNGYRSGVHVVSSLVALVNGDGNQIADLTLAIIAGHRKGRLLHRKCLGSAS